MAGNPRLNSKVETGYHKIAPPKSTASGSSGISILQPVNLVTLGAALCLYIS